MLRAILNEGSFKLRKTPQITKRAGGEITGAEVHYGDKAAGK